MQRPSIEGDVLRFNDVVALGLRLTKYDSRTGTIRTHHVIYDLVILRPGRHGNTSMFDVRRRLDDLVQPILPATDEVDLRQRRRVLTIFSSYFLDPRR